MKILTDEAEDKLVSIVGTAIAVSGSIHADVLRKVNEIRLLNLELEAKGKRYYPGKVSKKIF